MIILEKTEFVRMKDECGVLYCLNYLFVIDFMLFSNPRVTPRGTGFVIELKNCFNLDFRN